jgi:hypothetical protein
MRRWLGTALVAMMVLVATSSIATAATSTNSTQMTTARVKAAGISLEYPTSWTALALTKKGLAAQAEAWLKTNPQFAALLATADVSQFKLYALDAAPKTYSNVKVSVAPAAQGISLAYLRTRLSQKFAAAGATVLDAKVVKVSGKTAFRLDATVPVITYDGTTTDSYLGEELIPAASSSTWDAVSSSDDETGMTLVNNVLATVRRI